ncbi:AHBA synthesis associated protein [Kaistella antarctica]|uniref:AHBA synthesis associated protein n=1 Tax=Kaistella antarctica TaxID=266748 RepID=A0A3S4VFR4_9FLAO|nr:AHBA synthesis associated protein [Kaistella antarctica]
MMRLIPDEVVSFGDLDIDIISAKAAGVKGYFCKWGGTEPVTSKPDVIINTPSELTNWVV